MKKLILPIALLICVNTQAQLPQGIDSTFGTNGTVRYEPASLKNNNVGGIVVDANDKIIIAGTADGAKDDVFIMRTHKNGELDTSFNGTGMVVYDPKIGANDQAYGVDVQPDGKILVCGRTDGNTDYNALVMRLNPDGSFDKTFNLKGWREFAIGPEDNMAFGIKYHNNRIYVACGSESNSKFIYVVRFDMLGDYDASYGLLNGFSIVDINSNNYETFRDFQFTTNDDLLIMGSTYDGNKTQQFVYKVDSNAKKMVTSFGNNGIYQYSSGTAIYFRKMEQATDGSIYISGYENTANGYAGMIFKLTANGVLDNTFASGNGKALFKVNSGKTENERFYDLKILSDTNILLVGGYRDENNTNYPLTVVYKNNGLLNTNYNNTGYSYKFTYPANMTEGYRYAGIQSDDKVIICGQVSDTLQGNQEITLNRFKHVKVDTPTSISNIETAEIVSIYPNPTSGDITIKSDKNIERVQLLNVAGSHIQFLNPVRGNTYRIDASTPTGIYYLRIHTASAVVTERILLTN